MGEEVAFGDWGWAAAYHLGGLSCEGGGCFVKGEEFS